MARLFALIPSLKTMNRLSSLGSSMAPGLQKTLKFGWLSAKTVSLHSFFSLTLLLLPKIEQR